MNDDDIFKAFWDRELDSLIPKNCPNRDGQKLLAKACFNAGRTFEQRLSQKSKPSFIQRLKSLFL